MENRAHALLAGLFVLLLGIAGLASIWWFGGKEEATRDLVVVTRGNVTGLNPQAQVRYRGIRVGKVVDLRLDPADKRDILITVRIAADVPVTHGTTARLGFQGVTGLAHILLEDSGKNPAPLPEDDEPPRITMQASLFDELGEAGGNVLKQAQEFLKRVNAVLDDNNRTRLGATLDNVEATTRQLATATASLPQTMERLQRLVSDDNIKRLERSFDDSSQAIAAANGALTEWRRLAGELQSVSRQVELAVGSPGGSGLAGVAPRVNELTGELAATNRQLNRLLYGLEAAPQSLLFGAPASPPGPGEAGFVAPERNLP